MKPIETAITRIFATDRSIVGLGFLITESRIMTCAHVVADAVGIERDDPNPPSQLITVDFPLVDDNKKCIARVVVWLPSRDGTDDIAVLELHEAAPSSAKPANLVTVDKLWGAEFGVYGFPRYNPKGVWAKGKVSGLIEGKRIQIDAVEGNISYFIEPGFSGSPVYSNDPNINGVIGMAVSAESDPNIKAGFMIPSEVLLTKMSQRQPLPQLTDDGQTSPPHTPINMTDGKPQPVSSYTREGRPRVVYIGEFAEIKPAKRSKTVFIAHSFFGGDSVQMQDYRIFLSEGLTHVGYQPVFSGNASGTLLKTICKEIIDTEAGIFDVSGYNANVLIELGMSIGLNQPTIVIAQDDRKPLIDSLQQLNPLRYKDTYDLAEGIGQALKEQIQRYHQSGTSPRFCAACGLDCVARKHVSSPDYCYLIAGAHPENDKGIFFHLKKVAKNFRDHTGQALQFLQVEGDFNLTVCQWVEEIKRSKIVFFHSKENGDKRHSGSDNAATMVRTGIAIGLGVAWRMILKQGDEMPTDLKGYQRVIWQSSATAFDVELNGAVRTLLSEARPYGGMYDPLIPVEAVEDDEESGLILETDNSDQNRVPLFNVPEWKTSYVVPEPDFGTVRQHLINSDKNVVIAGQPGVGKTLLASALCHDQSVQERYRDGIFWFNARSLSTLDDLFDIYAEIFGELSGEGINVSTQSEAMVKVADLMKDRAFLLVLNGLDELASDIKVESFLDAFRWITTSDTNRLLITSRPNLLKEFEDQKDSFIIHMLGEKPIKLTSFAGQKIFLSHGHGDEFAGELVQILGEANLEVFSSVSDNRINPGDDWRQAIQDNMESAEIIIIIISEGSSEREPINFELEQAQRLGKPVIPILMSDVHLPPKLQEIQYIDFRTNRVDALNKLNNTLKEKLTTAAKDGNRSTRYLFMNYSRIDSPFARQIIDTIENSTGIEVWSNRKISVGSSWWDEIILKLEKCSGMIYLLSPESISSEYCRQEYNLALRWGITIIPILLQREIDIPETIDPGEIIDFSNGISVSGVKALLKKLSSSLSESSPPSDAETEVNKAREYQQIYTLISRQSTKQLGCRALSEFLKDNPSYDPENLREICKDTIALEIDPKIPNIDMVHVPAGEFILSTNEEDTVFHLPQFQIGKFPITNDQYQVFINAPNGYSTVKWWAFSPKAQTWREQHPTPQASKFKGNDHPRTAITWYEAVAFCNWLSNVTGEIYRLPTSFEWIKAARGTDSRGYPWGDEFDPSKANTRESQIRMTTPVDRYPAGASPYGAYDMSGNIWEWVNQEENLPTATDGETTKRVFGGSFLSTKDKARVDSYYKLEPGNRYSTIGFRVAKP